jgi:hypothetical protein
MASNGAVDPAAREGAPDWVRLRAAVRRALEDVDAWQRRARAAEKRVEELESALREVSGGNLDPVALSEQLRACERENRLLQQRMAHARDSVERIQSRLQFLEEDR